MLKKLCKSALNNKGMTLTEVLVALLLIGIIASTFLNVFLSAFRVSVRAQDITNYTYSTQSVIEEYRIYNYRELIDMQNAQTSKAPFDINGDNINDCFMEFTLEPYGVCDSTNGEDATYLHIIYFVDKALVITGQGDSIYTNINSATTISLNVKQGLTECVLVLNSNQMKFDRLSPTSPVVVMANLDLKDFGYNNTLNVIGDTGRVDVKVYGNDVIVEEFLSNIAPEAYYGINNVSTSLVRLTVELYEESGDTDSFFEMSEIIEIYNGEKDAIIP